MALMTIDENVPFTLIDLGETILRDTLLSYLNVSDLYRLGKTCKNLTFCKLYINTIIINKINDKLLSYFHNDLVLVRQFKKIMKETCSVISGSFIIQCIIDEDWNTDLDIYIPTIGNDLKTVDSYKNRLHEIYPKSIIDDFMNSTLGYGGSGHNPRYLGITKKYIHFVNKYENQSQIIGVKVTKDINQLQKFINSVFDFDICKNMYYIDNEGEHIKLCSLENIINKKCNLVLENKNFFRYCSVIGRRCKKYQYRGFNISNLVAMKTNIFLTLRDTSKCINKYYISDDNGKHYIFRTIRRDNYLVIYPKDKDSYFQLHYKKYGKVGEIICPYRECYQYNKCSYHIDCCIDFISPCLQHCHAKNCIFIII
jgi:hypothetical protein